ncbi:MAG: Gfo/Idh/MocA family oxidoreductase [Actinomycetes bacterium]
MSLRVGISGYGLAGRYFHGALLGAVGFEVVGAVTQNPDRIAHLHNDFPRAQAVATIQELLDLKLDLLVVASGNAAHASDAIAGLRAGVPTVVDKPMGRTLAETVEIINVAAECDVPVTTYFNRLWDSDILTIKRAQSERVLGDVFRFDSRFERFRPEPNPQAWRERSSAADGGGNLLDLQPHLVSTALHLFGPAEVVHASVRSIRGYADDDVVLVLKHESGVDSYLSASAIIGAPGPRVRVNGSAASLVIESLDAQEGLLRSGKIPTGGAWQEDVCTPAYLYHGEKRESYPAEPGNYATFYSLVKDAISGSGSMPISTSEILAVSAIIEQAREISIR